MTVEFNKITGDEVELFSIYPELFNNFWSNNDLVMEYDVSDKDLIDNKDYYDYLIKFGSIIKENDLIFPANLPFNIYKTSSPHYAFFDIKRNEICIEVTDLSELSLSAELTSLGEKCFKQSKDQNISMLEAIEQMNK